MASPKKSSRRPRVRLTHIEVHRGNALRLRIAVADEIFSQVGGALGLLLTQAVPGTQTSVVEIPSDAPGEAATAEIVTVPTTDFMITKHADDDEAYHATLRANFVTMISNLCDESLADVLEIARGEQNERAARAEGIN